MSFNITFDYRFDTSGFYTEEVRNALEAAGSIWEAIILDEFDDIASGHHFEISNPETDLEISLTLDQPIDDLLIFVGSRPSLSESTLGRGGPEFGSGASLFTQRLRFSDFEPYIGVITVDRSENWFFDQTPDTDDDIPPEKYDFITLALHELGHVLGIGTADISKELSIDGSLIGPNTQQLAKSYIEAESVPTEADGAHFKEGIFEDNTLMDPTMAAGLRTLPSAFDRAWLADIGYNVADFEGISFVQQGSQPPLATEANDRFYGTNLADELDALAGQDELSGEAGNDQLKGGPGNDAIWGGQGNDVLIGDAGSDQLSGNAGDDRMDGGSDHDNLWGGIGNDYLWGGDGNDYLQGDEGDDTIIGWRGDDSLWGMEGSDIFVFTANQGRDTINDFDIERDSIELDPSLGFADTSDFMARGLIKKPFANVSRIVFDSDNYVDIFHDSMQGSPLTEQHFRVSAESLTQRFDFNLYTPEDQPDRLVPGGTVGQVTVEPLLLGDNINITLTNGEGDNDNGLFKLDGQALILEKLHSTLGFSSYTVRLRATASDGASIEKIFEFDLENTQEASGSSEVDSTGDGSIDSIDSLLLMRYLFGTFPGDSLTGQLPSNTILNHQEAQEKLDGIIDHQEPDGNSFYLDIDRDGIISPLTDGLVTTHYISHQLAQLGSSTPAGWSTPDFISTNRSDVEINLHLQQLTGL